MVVYGRTLQQQDNNDSTNTPQYKQEELGWAAVQFFNYEGYDFKLSLLILVKNNLSCRALMHGSTLLSIWPKESNYIYGPAPNPGIYPYCDHSILSIDVAIAPNVSFPPLIQLDASEIIRGDFQSLDLQTQQQLLEITERDMLFKAPTEVREVLWEKRHYLYNIPAALPKVLLAAHSWEWACLTDLHGMLRCWKPMQPVQAIQLLLPT